jgi:hypothetical protein
MSHVRVHTGPDRWQLQTEEDIFWIDIWAVEAIAKVIRHVDDLGKKYDISLSERELTIRDPN